MYDYIETRALLGMNDEKVLSKRTVLYVLVEYLTSYDHSMSQYLCEHQESREDRAVLDAR